MLYEILFVLHWAYFVGLYLLVLWLGHKISGRWASSILVTVLVNIVAVVVTRPADELLTLNPTTHLLAFGQLSRASVVITFLVITGADVWRVTRLRSVKSIPSVRLLGGFCIALFVAYGGARLTAVRQAQEQLREFEEDLALNRHLLTDPNVGPIARELQRSFQPEYQQAISALQADFRRDHVVRLEIFMRSVTDTIAAKRKDIAAAPDAELVELAQSQAEMMESMYSEPKACEALLHGGDPSDAFWLKPSRRDPALLRAVVAELRAARAGKDHPIVRNLDPAAHPYSNAVRHALAGVTATQREIIVSGAGSSVSSVEKCGAVIAFSRSTALLPPREAAQIVATQTSLVAPLAENVIA